MKKYSEPKLNFRVKFSDPSDKKVYEVLVRNVEPSDFIGMIQLDGFIFKDQTKFVLLPEEEEARKKFNKTERLHVPYQHLILVEELEAEEVDIHHLPFVKDTAIRAVEDHPSEDTRE